MLPKIVITARGCFTWQAANSRADVFFDQLPVVLYSVLCYFIVEMCSESMCFLAYFPSVGFVEEVNFPFFFFS